MPRIDENKHEHLTTRLETILADNPLTPDIFYRFIQGNDGGDEKTTYQFLCKYAASDKSTNPFTIAFREHLRQAFEKPAKKAVKTYKNAIVPTPPDAKLDPEVTKSFAAFQSILYTVYDSIERNPFTWGWAGENGYTADAIKHNRVMNVLYALVVCGRLDGNVLVVDKKAFKNNYFIRYMEKVNLMLDGLGNTGFHIKGYNDKKSETFTVSCPNTPLVIPLMHRYFNKRNCLKCHDDCSVYNSGCFGKRSITPLSILSYRFLEDIDVNEAAFLAYMDSVEPELKKIQLWLREEAAKYGFHFHGGMDKGCLSYTKGSKQWLWVGRGTCWEYMQGHSYGIAVKTRPFKHIFDKYPDKAKELVTKFPNAFNSKCQECRICRFNDERGGGDHHRCGHGLYFFTDPTLDDVKILLEYWKLENKIK